MTTYTAQQIKAIGGGEWKSSDGTKHRVYLNNVPELLGLEIDHYKSGNIASAARHGKTISNSEASRLLGAISKIYLDVADGKIYFQWGWTADRYDKKQLMTEVMDAIAAKVAAAETPTDGQGGPATDGTPAAAPKPETTPPGLIAELRAAGRTAREIAAAVGVHVSTVYRWARGVFRPTGARAAALTALTV